MAMQEADKLTVTWKPPLTDNGCPITLYYVEMASASGKSRKLGAWVQIYQGDDTTCTVDGLQPGREYTCRVRAANKVRHATAHRHAYLPTPHAMEALLGLQGPWSARSKAQDAGACSQRRSG